MTCDNRLDTLKDKHEKVTEKITKLNNKLGNLKNRQHKLNTKISNNYKTFNTTYDLNAAIMDYYKNGNTFRNPIINNWILGKNIQSLNGLLSNINFKKDDGKIDFPTDWDVSNVTNMKSLFAGSKNIGDLSGWDVSNVTEMGGMFFDTEFNGDLSKWIVSSVISMRSMFYSATKFNQDLSKWNVISVTDMSYMFYGATSFNNNIFWTVSNVANIENMFYNATKFNQDLSTWLLPSNTWNFSENFLAKTKICTNRDMYPKLNFGPDQYPSLYDKMTQFDIQRGCNSN